MSDFQTRRRCLRKFCLRNALNREYANAPLSICHSFFYRQSQRRIFDILIFASRFLLSCGFFGGLNRLIFLQAYKNGRIEARSEKLGVRSEKEKRRVGLTRRF